MNATKMVEGQSVGHGFVKETYKRYERFKRNDRYKPSLKLKIAAAVFVLAQFSGCGGGGREEPLGVTGPDPACSGECGTTVPESLSVADVETIIAQGVAEAQARNVQATIAVTDRVGNVLGVFRMGDPADRSMLVATATADDGTPLISGGLEGLRLPTAAVPFNIDQLGAIAKAITGAYLSSEGNAFTTRTANQIVQEHFNPGELNQPAGPLFGVQFSQLSCSDFSQRFSGGAAEPGPHRSPLGLAADPGGLPLYRNGVPVGGVGVIADGRYGIDPAIGDIDTDIDELIAVAASFGWSAPLDRRANRITVDGKTFRFSDAGVEDLMSDPANAPAFSTATGALVNVTGYFDGTIRAGTAFGTPASGIRPAVSGFDGQDAFVFVNAANVNRFPARPGTDAVETGGNQLTVAETQSLLSNALRVANSARAQIRRPLNSPARVTISVVDTNGEILGMVRTRDAPVFGADVSLQKARTAAFFSSASSADFLNALPPTNYVGFTDAGPELFQVLSLGDYVTDLRNFLEDPLALANGAFAFSDRAGGNLSRPFFPDGIDERGAGPLSKPAGEWSPFSTGLQLDLAINALVQHVLFSVTDGALAPDVVQGCAGAGFNPGTSTPGLIDLGLVSISPAAMTNRVANGFQIFPGSVPIYRGNMLIGGIGVSGDGVDQDDMISFLGLHEAGLETGSINNAPPEIRADQLMPRDTRLRYIQCPQSPFLEGGSFDPSIQRPCEGL